MSAAKVVSSESLLVPPLAVALPGAAQRLGQIQQHITLTGGQMAAMELSDSIPIGSLSKSMRRQLLIGS